MAINKIDDGDNLGDVRLELNKVIEGYTAGALQTMTLGDPVTISPLGDFVGVQGELDRTYHVELSLGAVFSTPNSADIRLSHTFTLKHPGEFASVVSQGDGSGGLMVLVDTDLMIYALISEPAPGYFITPTIKQYYKASPL